MTEGETQPQEVTIVAEEVPVEEEVKEDEEVKRVDVKDRFRRVREMRGGKKSEEVKEEGGEAAEDVPKQPVGRRTMMQGKTEGDDVEVEIPLWKAVIFGIVAVIIAIDDEWLWIPGTIYGVMYYCYKRACAVGSEIRSMPPQPLVAGAVGGAVATAVSPSLASATKSFLGDRAKGIRTTSRAMFLSPGGVMSSLTWGLRMTMFTYFMRRSIEDTHAVEDSFYHRYSSLVVGGAFTETAARTVTAPGAKMIDLTRKNPTKTPGEVFKMLYKGKGVFGLWQGMAPYRVEVPHMSILLGTYGMLRGQAAKYMPEHERETWNDMLVHVPTDMVCGGIAAGVAHTVTHAWRCSYEATRGNDSHFSKAVGMSSCPLVARHATVPLHQALALRVPHTALIFGVYGFALSAFTDKFPHNGVTGWGEHEVQRATSYGGGLKNTIEEEKSFWAFFGIRFAQRQTYDSHKYKSEDDK